MYVRLDTQCVAVSISSSQTEENEKEAFTLTRALREIFYALGQGYKITTLFQIRVTLEYFDKKIDLLCFEDEMVVIHVLIDLCAKYINTKMVLFGTEQAQQTHAAIIEGISLVELRKDSRSGFTPTSLEDFYKYILFRFVRVDEGSLAAAFAKPIESFVAIARAGQLSDALRRQTHIGAIGLAGGTMLIDDKG